MSQDCFDYQNTTDSIKQEIDVDPDLSSDSFNTDEASYPWYILENLENEDESFSTALDREITPEDKTHIEHTANCVSTHQGRQVMNYCDATLDAGVLQLEVHGGLPAYVSSLFVTVNDSWFWCAFKATYPAPVHHCRWKILARELKLKSLDIQKGKRIYGWIAVDLEEMSTYRETTTTNT